jgi:hypothetical protein
VDLGGTGGSGTPELEPFKNRIGVDLGGTGGSGTPELEPLKEPDRGGSRSHTGFWNRNWNLLRTGSEWI